MMRTNEFYFKRALLGEFYVEDLKVDRLEDGKFEVNGTIHSLLHVKKYGEVSFEKFFGKIASDSVFNKFLRIIDDKEERRFKKLMEHCTVEPKPFFRLLYEGILFSFVWFFTITLVQIKFPPNLYLKPGIYKTGHTISMSQIVNKLDVNKEVEFIKEVSLANAPKSLVD